VSGRRPGAPHHPLGCLEIPLDLADTRPAKIVLILLAIKIICAQERKGEGEGRGKLGYQSWGGQGEKGEWTPEQLGNSLTIVFQLGYPSKMLIDIQGNLTCLSS
jgi:hypothetical protein